MWYLKTVVLAGGARACVMRHKLWLLIYLGMVIVSGCLAAPIAYSGRGISIAGCKRAPEPDQFISSCSARRFGDFEHAAFWFGIERRALANLKAADVVFTGSSRTMFAFSTAEVRSYFAARGLRHFNLGFGYEDQQTFFSALAVKHHLRPRVLVIGVDPYFNDRVSEPALAAMHDRWEELGRALVKKGEMWAQPALCNFRFVNCEIAPTAFRSSVDGYFFWRDSLKADRQRPRVHRDQLRDFQVNVPLSAIEANNFLKRIGMPADCVVLVPMPTTEIWPKPDPIKQLAETIGAMYIDADTGDDLTFVDEAHLSFDSSKRFSSEFVRAFDGLPQTCLNSSPLSARTSVLPGE